MISIPSGAIKSYAAGRVVCVIWEFQFLLVRLKVAEVQIY